MRLYIFLLTMSAFCSCVKAQEVASLESGFINLKYGIAVLKDSKGAERTINRDSTSDLSTPVPIYPGDTVEVKEDSDCSLVFPQVGSASLGKDAKVIISAANPDPKKTSSVELLGGKLFLDIDGKSLAAQKKQFRVKTPTTILAVKGTQFFADAQNEIETVGVHEGRVIVAEDVSGKFTTLNSGNAVSAKPGGLTKNRTLTAEEKKLSEIYDSFAVEFIPAEKRARRFSATYCAQEDPTTALSTDYPKLIKAEKSEELDGTAVKITIQPYPKARTGSVSASTKFEIPARFKSAPQFIHFMLKSENVIGFQLSGYLDVDDKIYEVIHPDGNVIQFPKGSKPGTWVPFLLPMKVSESGQKPDGLNLHVDPTLSSVNAVESVANVVKNQPEYTIEVSPFMIGVVPEK